MLFKDAIKRTHGRLLFMVFITTTTVCVSELNVLLVYPVCSKLKYYGFEADCRTSARSPFPSTRTPLSLSLSLSVRLLCSALSVKTDMLLLLILHASIAEITAQLLSLSICVAYLILSDDGTIINQDFCAD